MLVALTMSATFPVVGSETPNWGPPPDGPDHGVNETTFLQLWSEDPDNGSLTREDVQNASTEPDAVQALARSTDILFPSPPKATGQWNDGDLHDFEPGDSQTSVHPNGTELDSGVYIKDAYVRIFAVQPSTVLHESDRETQYVASDGELSAILDYRVLVPEDDNDGSRQIKWGLRDTSIDEIRFIIDGETVDTAHETYTPEFRYRDLDGNSTFTIEADISVELRKEVRTCDSFNETVGSCETNWDVNVTHPTETVMVSDRVETTVYDLSGFDGRRVTFAASGETGVVAGTDVPWTSLRVGDAVVRNKWWFYTASDRDWATMVESTARNDSERVSSTRPLQVHAIPSEYRPYVPSDGDVSTEPEVELRRIWEGEEQSAPVLPSYIDVSMDDHYRNTESVVVTSEDTSISKFEQVEVTGLVRGQSITESIEMEQIIRESELELTVLNMTAATATVEARVKDKETGEPVTTGNVTVEGTQSSLNESGAAVVTIERPPAMVRGSYEPVPWWETEQAYTSDSTQEFLPGDYPGFGFFVDLVVVTVLWFVPLGLLIYGLNRASNGVLLESDYE
jgi:hypothetical protein